MIKPEMVPPDAMYAAWKCMNAGMTLNDAIAAALNAWPEMEEHVNWPYGKLTHIILPLPPQERRMRRETKPCPFYGMPCEYVPMAEKSDAQAAEIERLRAALRRWEQTGCPDCSGDCCAANIPISGCIMQETRAALEERT